MSIVTANSADSCGATTAGTVSFPAGCTLIRASLEVTPVIFSGRDATFCTRKVLVVAFSFSVVEAIQIRSGEARTSATMKAWIVRMTSRLSGSSV
jgi:hypothetical protein